MRYFVSAMLSENLGETPEGYLVCNAVPIARLGEMEYLESEVDWSADEEKIPSRDGKLIIKNTEYSLFDDATIASYEGKPVTIGHPKDFLGPENWKEFAVGTVTNVRRGEGNDSDKLLADLLITDKEAIYAIREKRLREVSAGYDSKGVEAGAGIIERTAIMGNHVALVKEGRAGAECAVRDEKPKSESSMSKLKDAVEKLKLAFKSVDEAMEPEKKEEEKKDSMPEGMKEVFDAIMKRLDALEAAKAEDEEPEEEKKEESKDEESEEKKEESKDESSEEKKEEESKDMNGAKDSKPDADTISRAEILAPGIEKKGDLQAESLKVAMKQKDSADVIKKLTGGKEINFASKDAVSALFVAASEMLKDERSRSLVKTRSIDSLPSLQCGTMTPDKINEINAKYFSAKK